jgi:hypothetical protein
MKSAGKIYLRNIHSQLSFLATWLPNTKMQLGDVGILQGEYFKRMTTLKELGIPFTVRHGKAPVEFNYTSASGVSMQSKAKGKTAVGSGLPAARAAIIVKFSEQGAFVFQTSGAKVNEIEDKYQVGQAIIQLYEQGRWQADWGVVDTVVETGAATILVSDSDAAALELSANGSVELSGLASLQAGFTVNVQAGDVIRFVAAQGLTPLFRLSRVKASWFQRLVGGSKPILFGGMSADDPPPVPADKNVFEAITPEP